MWYRTDDVVDRYSGGGTPTTIYLFPSPRCVRIIQTHPNRSVSMPRPLPVHPPGVPLQEVIALRAIDNSVPFFPSFLFFLSKTGLRPNQWAAGMLEDKARSAREGGRRRLELASTCVLDGTETIVVSVGLAAPAKSGFGWRRVRRRDCGARHSQWLWERPSDASLVCTAD